MPVLSEMRRTGNAISPGCCAGYHANCPYDPVDLMVLGKIGMKSGIFGRPLWVIHSTDFHNFGAKLC